MRGGGGAQPSCGVLHTTFDNDRMLSSAGVCGSHQGISRVRYGRRKAARTARYSLPYPTAACSRLQPQHRCRCSALYPAVSYSPPLTGSHGSTQEKRLQPSGDSKRMAQAGQRYRHHTPEVKTDEADATNAQPASRDKGASGLASPKICPARYVCAHLRLEAFQRSSGETGARPA